MTHSTPHLTANTPQTFESLETEHAIENPVHCQYKDCALCCERPEEDDAEGQAGPYLCPHCKRSFCSAAASPAGTRCGCGGVGGGGEGVGGV